MSLDLHPTALLWRDRSGLAKHDHVQIELSEWPADVIPGVVPDEVIYLPGIRQCEITIRRDHRSMTDAEKAAALAWLKALAAHAWRHIKR